MPLPASYMYTVEGIGGGGGREGGGGSCGETAREGRKNASPLGGRSPLGSMTPSLAPPPSGRKVAGNYIYIYLQGR